MKMGRKNSRQKKRIKNVERLRQESKRVEELETARFEVELQKIKEDEQKRYYEELANLEGRMAEVEKTKTESEILKEEVAKLNSAFDKEMAKIEDEEKIEEIKYQKRIAGINDIPKKNKELICITVNISRKHSSYKQELNFKVGPQEVLNSVVVGCLKIENEYEKQAQEYNYGCDIKLKDYTEPVDLYEELGSLQQDESGIVVFFIVLPTSDLEENDKANSDHKLLTHEDVENFHDGENCENERELERDSEIEIETKMNEEEEKEEIERLLNDLLIALKENTKETLWNQKNMIREKNQNEIRKKEEEYRKNSKKYSNVRESIREIQAEKNSTLERLRKKQKEKSEKMKEEFERSEKYKQLSISLPAELTVSHNGIRVKIAVDSISTIEDVFRHSHNQLSIPLSTFSYLQYIRKDSFSFVIPRSDEQQVSVLFFGSKFIQLSLRVPSHDHQTEEAKTNRDLEEREADEKAQRLKEKVERGEEIKVEDIPWPSFLQKVRKFEKVTCFDVFNVFADDPPEYIKQTKKKKLVWWHPDKLIWKNATLHEEHETIIKERQEEVIHILTEYKDILTAWQSDNTNT